MKKLPIPLKRIIRKKRFKLDTQGQCSWRGGLKITYRITWIVADGEDWYESRSPLNPGWSSININLKVSGKVETATNRYDPDTNHLVDIKQIVGKYKRCGGNMNGYDSYYTDPYDAKWGYQAHKKVRNEIRMQVREDVKNYLKLVGIATENKYDGINIYKINWE